MDLGVRGMDTCCQEFGKRPAILYAGYTIVVLRVVVVLAFVLLE